MKSKKFKNGRMIQKKIPRKSEKLLNINTKLNQSLIFVKHTKNKNIFYLHWKKKKLEEKTR